MLKLWNKLVAKLAKWLHSIGLTKNEAINVGGYRYPIAEFLGFSDEKITEILKKPGLTPPEIQFTFGQIEKLRRDQLQAIMKRLEDQ